MNDEQTLVLGKKSSSGQRLYKHYNNSGIAFGAAYKIETKMDNIAFTKIFLELTLHFL